MIIWCNAYTLRNLCISLFNYSKKNIHYQHIVQCHNNSIIISISYFNFTFYIFSRFLIESIIIRTMCEQILPRCNRLLFYVSHDTGNSEVCKNKLYTKYMYCTFIYTFCVCNHPWRNSNLYQCYTI